MSLDRLLCMILFSSNELLHSICLWLWPLMMMSQVSQLLAVLYTLSPANEAFCMLSYSNSLSESQWASYFHQVSLGTHLNYQLFSRIGKQKDENSIQVDVSSMNSNCFSCTFNAIIKCLYVGALCISYIISCLLSIEHTLLAKFGYLTWTSSIEFNWWYLLFNLNITNLSILNTVMILIPLGDFNDKSKFN